jgi:hypothetical protein
MPAGISLLVPVALWGLAALLVPLVLHLLGRGQRQRILVASVRDLAPRPALSGLRLAPSDPALLLARCLLLALLALALAQPACTSRSRTGGAAVAPEPVDLVAGAEDDVWGAIRAADRDLPLGVPLRVEAPSTPRTLRGSRPRVDRTVEWSSEMGTPELRSAEEAVSRQSSLPAAVLWWSVALLAIGERILAARRLRARSSPPESAQVPR